MKQIKPPKSIFIILCFIIFVFILFNNMMNAKTNGYESKMMPDSIYVTIKDSLVGSCQNDNQGLMKIIIKDDRNNNGYNPFLMRDTAKHKQHSIRELYLTHEGWVTDRSVDSVCLDGRYFYNSYRFCINNDTILSFFYQNKNGGIGVGSLYIKGYHVSKSTPHGGYYIEKRCPDDTIHRNLPIGEQQYIYKYDSFGRLIAINNSDDNAIIFSKRFNEVGEWYEIQFKDLVIKRH